jgi:magnesium-transporting ATPase (P-type)
LFPLDLVTVTEIWLDRHVAWDSFASLMRPEPRDAGDKSEDFAAPNSFEPLYLVASLCNNARVSEVSMDVEGDTGRRRSHSQSGDMSATLPRRQPSMARQVEYFGNPSEVALLRFCNSLRSVQSIRDKYRNAFEIPFNSAHKYHLVVVADVSTTTVDGKCQYNTLMKGAPELIVQRCTHYMLKVRQARRVLEPCIATDYSDPLSP